MKCKWRAEFEGTCTNDACPYCGDACRVNEHPEVCKHMIEAPEIPELDCETIINALKLCSTDGCSGLCALKHWDDYYLPKPCDAFLMEQAAGMLEKLTKDVVPRDFHEKCLETEIKKRVELESQFRWVSVKDKDKLPKDIPLVFTLDARGYVSCGYYEEDGWHGCCSRDVTHWTRMPPNP